MMAEESFIGIKAGAIYLLFRNGGVPRDQVQLAPDGSFLAS
ncbi:hypothetical protein [Bordetella genomosp. 9]|nr:hypothetical protein [Bordetella genomosp. 9]